MVSLICLNDLSKFLGHYTNYLIKNANLIKNLRKNRKYLPLGSVLVPEDRRRPVTLFRPIIVSFFIFSQSS